MLQDGSLIQLALVLDVDLAVTQDDTNVSLKRLSSVLTRTSLELVDKAHDLILLQRRVLLGELDSLHREWFWRVSVLLSGRKGSGLGVCSQIYFKMANWNLKV